MEKIEIKTHGRFKLTAWKDTIQFIVLDELLTALGVEYKPEVIDYIKQDVNWYCDVKKMEIPGLGEVEVMQLTRVLGLIYWLPDKVMNFIRQHEVATALVVHLETYLEFFQWKIAEVEKHIKIVDDARDELDNNSEYIIEQQAQLIKKLQDMLNLKDINK